QSFQMYFNCPVGTSDCSGAASIGVPEASQVINPVAALASDNNGVILQLPPVSASGAQTSSGYMIMGIGTQTNNTPPAGTVTFQADQYSSFLTYFNGQSLPNSAIDSGTNGYYFPEVSGLNGCSYAQDFLCPSGLITAQAVQAGASGSPAEQINF